MNASARPARLHVDTDFAGDPDDACALAMLLGCADAEVVAVTTALEDGGRRHDCVRAILDLAGRSDIPSAAGFERTLTGQRFACAADDPRHWPDRPAPVPTPPGAALDLLAASARRGATVLAIGGFTNLAALELARPGSLAGVRVVAKAGWIEDPPPGWPQWGASMDFNTQCDTAAALIVAEAGADVVLVTLPVAMRAQLRLRDIPRLQVAGPIGELLARQSLVHRDTSGFQDLAEAHPALADDLVNFHWDPVAAAVALGWDCVALQPAAVCAESTGGIVAFSAHVGDGPGGVTVDIDEAEFRDRWSGCIAAIRNRALRGA